MLASIAPTLLSALTSAAFWFSRSVSPWSAPAERVGHLAEFDVAELRIDKPTCPRMPSASRMKPFIRLMAPLIMSSIAPSTAFVVLMAKSPRAAGSPDQIAAMLRKARLNPSISRSITSAITGENSATNHRTSQDGLQRPHHRFAGHLPGGDNDIAHRDLRLRRLVDLGRHRSEADRQSRDDRQQRRKTRREIGDDFSRRPDRTSDAPLAGPNSSRMI